MVVDARRREVEVQVEEPPVRATVAVAEGEAPPLGAPVAVRLAEVALDEGRVRLELAS